MKICVINSLYPPYVRGGAEEMARTLVGVLKDAGHDVMVITLKEKGLKVDRTLQETVTVFRFAPFNLFSFININKQPAWKRLIWHGIDMLNLHSFWQVRSILKKEQPELVLTHNLKGIGYTIPKAIKSLGIRHIHTLHDIQLIDPSGLKIVGQHPHVLANLFLPLYRAINRMLFGSPDGIVAPSQWLIFEHQQQDFFKHSSTKVIPNPTPIPVGPVRTSTPTKLHFLYVGQVVEHKGIVWLIEQLKAMNQDFVLTVIGIGSDMAQAQEVAGNDERIKFLGFVPHHEIAQHYQNNHFTIVPSLCYENSPTVIYESYAMGTPVIAANIGGIPELVIEKETGYLFSPGDSDDFKVAFEKAIKNLHNWIAMSQHCQAEVSELSPENYLQKLWD